MPIVPFAHAVGIRSIEDLKAKGFVGVLTTNEEKTQGVILVKQGDREARRRFTIGHELGHFLIRSHRAGLWQCTAEDMRERRGATLYQRQEWEANRFSAGLLMPKPWFQRDMGRLGSIDIGHIQQLSESYVTSFEAAANHYLDLTDEACAVIFSTDGIIRDARPSSDFHRSVSPKGMRFDVAPNFYPAVSSFWRFDLACWGM